MRELSNNDIFILSQIIDKMDLKLPSVPKKTEDGKRDFALSFGLTLVRNMHKAKDEINTLLASLTGKTITEVESLTGIETLNLFAEMFGKKDFTDFFG